MFGYFDSNAALNFPDKSLGKEVTITKLPELARALEANIKKEIKSIKIFFIFPSFSFLKTHHVKKMNLKQAN
jgi:hypothetical protein